MNPRSFRVETREALAKLLDDKEFAAAKDIQVRFVSHQNANRTAR